MAASEFVTYLLELMAPWATVTARRMFGGYGLYRDGTMFALVANDALYLKVDETTRPRFLQTGSTPMIYHARERTIPMSYWSAPAAALETPGEMALWCALAYGAALRFAADRKAKPRTDAESATGAKLKFEPEARTMARAATRPSSKAHRKAGANATGIRKSTPTPRRVAKSAARVSPAIKTRGRGNAPARAKRR